MAYGEKLMGYDPETGMFYAGRDSERRFYVENPSPIKWTRNINAAVQTRSLKTLSRARDHSGGRMKIIPVSKAIEIMEARKNA